MTTTVVFDRRGDYYAVRFPYRPELVETLKLSVPGWARRWNPTAKHWVVDACHAHTLGEHLAAMGATVLGLTAAPTGPDAEAGAWARLLFAAVGAARASAVHRALSRVLHPDTATGDERLQQQLNDAAAALQQSTR